jgi:hypothetical protein
MKTIVHIGMPKTGSSALQSCMQASEAYLAQRGLLYPKNPPGERAIKHVLLVAQIARFEKLPRSLKNRAYYTKDAVSDKLDEFLRDLRHQIETQRPDALILSDEGMFRQLPPGRHRTLRRTYRALGDDLRFVAYLRKPSEHYLSNMQQGIKASATVRLPRANTYRKVLESYEACFGEGAVSVRLFHRDHLENGDIVADFCKHYLGEFAIDPARLQPGRRTNETLSAESIDVLRRYRSAFHAGRDNVYAQDSRALQKELAKADREHGAARPRLQPGLAEAIDYGHRDCLWLRDRYGVAFPGLDYDRLATAASVPEPTWTPTVALEELIVIDREMQGKILNRLTQSPWAAGDAARKAWVNGLRMELA